MGSYISSKLHNSFMMSSHATNNKSLIYQKMLQNQQSFQNQCNYKSLNQHLYMKNYLIDNSALYSPIEQTNITRLTSDGMSDEDKCEAYKNQVKNYAIAVISPFLDTSSISTATYFHAREYIFLGYSEEISPKNYVIPYQYHKVYNSLKSINISKIISILNKLSDIYDLVFVENSKKSTLYKIKTKTNNKPILFILGDNDDLNLKFSDSEIVYIDPLYGDTTEFEKINITCQLAILLNQ